MHLIGSLIERLSANARLLGLVVRVRALQVRGCRLESLSNEFLVGAFRRKTQTIVVTFFKTNDLTDFINFISKH